MKPLTIELKQGAPLNFRFVGWQSNLVAFYARDANANPKIIELSPPYPHNLDDGQPFAFPKLEPTEIFPVRLVPPRCAASAQEINEFTQRLFREQILFPESKHEPALRRALKWCHAKAAKEQAAEIAAVKKATPLELFPFDAYHLAVGTTKPSRKPEAVEAERRRQINEIENKYRPRLALTLAALKRGSDDYAESLRNHVLITAWAKETATDLEKMKQTAREFESQWYRAWGTEHQPPPDAMPNDRAAVKFGIRFGLGTIFYLRGVKIRNLLTPDEAEDFEKLATAHKPPEPMVWHTDGFATIRRSNAKGETIKTLPLTNEFRALCQLLAEHPDQTAQFSEIQAQVGKRIHLLDRAAGVEKPALESPRRIRDLLRNKTGKQLLMWNVLVVKQRGRDKFLQLHPPKPAK